MKRRIVLIAGLLVLATIIAGCDLSTRPTPTLSFASLIAVIGEVLPAERANVSVRVSGTVMEVSRQVDR